MSVSPSGGEKGGDSEVASALDHRKLRGLDRSRVLIVGAGFAGFHCARLLDRRLEGTAELILVNPVDHMLYSPLLPDVVGGVVDPSHIAVPLATSLPSTRVLIGTVSTIDITGQTCTVRGVDGHEEVLVWDRLVLNPGSVTNTYGVAGVLDHAHGFKSLAEAVYVRERILRQLQLASATTDADTRQRHGSFVVVGGGSTGLELAAHGRDLARAALRQHPALDSEAVRWTVMEAGPSVLGEFSTRLARRALHVLGKSGVEVRVNAAVAEVASDHVRLADGETHPTETVIWTAGVTPAPLISQLGLALQHGRVIVDDRLQTRDHPHVFALGDAAAVPDVTHPGQLAAQTAQNAQRQAVTAAGNVAASVGHGKGHDYKHHNLGLAVDLGGRNAIATPFGVRLSGVLAKLTVRAYRLLSLPSGRLRVLSDWVCATISGPEIVEIGLVDSAYATIEAEADEGRETVAKALH